MNAFSLNFESWTGPPDLCLKLPPLSDWCPQWVIPRGEVLAVGRCSERELGQVS